MTSIREIRLHEMFLLGEKLRNELGDMFASDTHFSYRLFWNERCSIRAYFIAKIFQYVRRIDKFDKVIELQEVLDLITLGELTITRFYLENHVHDRKFRIWEADNEEKNKAEQEKIKKIITEFIQDRFPTDKVIYTQKNSEKLFKLYNWGIDLDQGFLTYQNFLHNGNFRSHLHEEALTYVAVDRFIQTISDILASRNGVKLNQLNYLKLYLSRSFLINGVFFQSFTELILGLYPFASIESEKLLEFSRMFGMLQQIVNDNCDYIPFSEAFETSSKYKEDTFSDARRRLVTLPIMIHHERIGKNACWVLDYYQNPQTSPSRLHLEDLQVEMLQKLLEKKSLGQAMKITAILGTHVMGNSGLNTNNPSVKMLLDMVDIARANKFYKYYKTYHKGIVENNSNS